MEKSTINHMLPRYYKDYDVDILLDKAYTDTLSEEELSILSEVYIKCGKTSMQDEYCSKYHKGYDIDNLITKAQNGSITNVETSILNEVYGIYPKLIFAERERIWNEKTKGQIVFTHVNIGSLFVKKALEKELRKKTTGE